DGSVMGGGDQGFAPLDSAVSMTNILRNAGVDTTKVAIRTSGPAANIYINLQGRESGGTVDAATYNALLAQITAAVKNAVDSNPRFNGSLGGGGRFKAGGTRPGRGGGGTGVGTRQNLGPEFPA